jgi:superfamily II DNA/RNA helicase
MALKSFHDYLAQRGVKVESIHGDKTHSNRQRALGMFKEINIQALLLLMWLLGA